MWQDKRLNKVAVYTSQRIKDCQISMCVLNKILQNVVVCWRKGIAYPWVLNYSFAAIPLEGFHLSFCCVWTSICCRFCCVCQAVFICLWMNINLLELGWCMLVSNSLSDENYSTVLERHCKPRTFATCWMFHCADAVCANPVA